MKHSTIPKNLETGGVKGRPPKGRLSACLICEEPIWIRQCEERPRMFCSLKCRGAYKHREHTILIECGSCKKTIRRTRAKVKNYKKMYCSKECRNLDYQKPLSTSRTTLRRQFDRRGLLKNCVRCGYNKLPNILVIHHKDRKHTNPHPTNLEILCPNCHAEEHYQEDRKHFYPGVKWGATKKVRRRRD